MKIKEITSEHGNDFSAVLECEHCGHTDKIATGYHDNFYHTQVIPGKYCPQCGRNRAGEREATLTDGEQKLQSEQERTK